MLTPIELRRRRARTAVVGALYAAELSRRDIAETYTGPNPIGEHDVFADGDRDFGRALVEGVSEHTEELDSWIAGAAEHWTLERMPPIDLAIMRMALYELLWLDDVPAGATINEAVELAKCYSTTDSSRFVNGLLGRLAQRAAAARE